MFSPIKDLVDHDVEITDLVINMEYRYYYNSTSQGKIMVWKFDKTKSPIHTFSNHFKTITQLMPLKDDLFLSASLDGTLRVWSLSKFQQLYCLNISEG